MLTPILSAAALTSILFLIGCIRLSGRADDASEQAMHHFAQCNRPGCSCVGVRAGHAHPASQSGARNHG